MSMMMPMENHDGFGHGFVAAESVADRLESCADASEEGF